MSQSPRNLTADDAYDQLMDWLARSLKDQGLEHLPDQTRRVILLQLITSTPELATRLPTTLAKQLADAAVTLLHRLPPELADQVRQVVRTLDRLTAHAARQRKQEETAS
jgi:hypothetical protein